jgi:HEAT repeat protein
MNRLSSAVRCLINAPSGRARECAARRILISDLVGLVVILALFAAGCTALRSGSYPETLTVAKPAAASSDSLMDVIRTSLGTESWRQNHAWTAKAEWDHRKLGFPSAKDLRWKFAKDWDPSAEKDETDVRIDKPAAKQAAANSTQPTKSEASDADAKSKTDKNKNDTASATPTVDKKSDPPSEAEDATHWDGLWPLTVADLLHPGEKTGTGSRGAPSQAMGPGVRCLRRLAHTDNLVGWNAAILWAQQDPVSAVEIADLLQRLIVKPPEYLPESSEASAGTEKESPFRPKSGVAKQTLQGTAKENSTSEPRAQRIRKTLSATTRCAAAEAWCLVLAASAADPIDGLAPAGRLLEQTGLPNDLRAELFRGVARWVRPSRIPRLENAFREGQGKKRPPFMIRRAAIEACLVYAVWHPPEASPGTENKKAVTTAASSKSGKTIWPETVLNCRIDPDFEVRRTFIRWLGFAQTPDAFDLLKTQAEGADFELRRTAYESLSVLHTNEARAELQSQLTKSRDALRAAAVKSLAVWGLHDVTPYARDSSDAVRRTIAQELGKVATLDSAVALSELTIDRSVEVQLAAIRATEGWPDSLAFPLLLHAMRDSAAKTRHEAAQLLSSRRKVAGIYRFDSPTEQREAAVTAIAAEIGSSLNYLDQVLKREPRATAEVNELRTTELRAHLTALIENPANSPAADAARDWLTGIGPSDVPIIEAYLQVPTRAPTAAIYHDVLPKVSAVYAALADLQSRDVNIRRRGAKALADRGRAVTLSRPVLLRLHEILARESDEVVWRLSLNAIGSDATEDCAEVANLALQHRSAEVRELGCEYLAHHGQPAQAAWLLELLDDHSRSVQLAAIRALGNCGNQIAIRGVPPTKERQTSPNLRSLLTSPDQQIRFAAAISLCRLGAAEGMQEIVRLSYHSNHRFREQAVKEMGLSGQTRFVQHLVTLGWTEQNDEVRRAILEALDRLVPPENRPPAVGGLTAWDAKIKCWVQWLERGNGSPAQNNPAGSPLASRPGRES